MKTTIVLLSFLVLSVFASAQKNPPAVVTKAFTQKFTKAEKVKWDKESPNEWEAEFKLNGQESSATFDLSGQWLETETEIEKDKLPDAVKASIAKQYADYKIVEAETYESSKFTGYEIALKGKGNKLEVQATKEGKLTAKKEKADKD